MQHVSQRDCETRKNAQCNSKSNRVEIRSVICNINSIQCNRNETCNFDLQATGTGFMEGWWWLNTALFGMENVCLLIQSHLSN